MPQSVEQKLVARETTFVPSKLSGRFIDEPDCPHYMGMTEEVFMELLDLVSL